MSRLQAGDAGHDCARAGCQPHRCRPMSPKTIRQIHAILSDAFAAAVRCEWIDRNPAGSAKLPKTRHRSPTSPTPTDVAAVITAAKGQELDLLALYMWLAAVTAPGEANCAGCNGPTSIWTQAWCTSRSATSSSTTRRYARTPRRTRTVISLSTRSLLP